MLVYRFRGTEYPEYTVDILRNSRLYCANWRELNDPMEGTYSTLKVVDPSKKAEAREAIFRAKVSLRVCSLSTTYKKHTMWAYYADSFRGVAVEFDLPPELLTPIDYASGRRIQSWAEEANPYEIARDILTKKHSDWREEQELRLLHEGEYFPLPPGCIKSVILGSRIRPEFERKVRGAAADIPVLKLTIRSGNLHAEPA